MTLIPTFKFIRAAAIQEFSRFRKDEVLEIHTPYNHYEARWVRIKCRCCKKSRREQILHGAN